MDKRLDIIATAAKVIGETVRDMAATEKTGPEKSEKSGAVGPDRNGPGGRERAGELGRVRECEQASEQTNECDPGKEGKTDCPKEGAAACPKEGRSSYSRIGVDADHHKTHEEIKAEYRRNTLKPQNWTESLNREQVELWLTTGFGKRKVCPTRNDGVKNFQYEAEGTFRRHDMQWPCHIFKCQYTLSYSKFCKPFLTIIIAAPKMKTGGFETEYFTYDVFDGDHPYITDPGENIPIGFISGSHAKMDLFSYNVFDLLCIDWH